MELGKNVTKGVGEGNDVTDAVEDAAVDKTIGRWFPVL